MESYTFEINYLKERIGSYNKELNYINWGSQETYEKKVERLAKIYPAVAEAKAHIDALIAMVEHGE